MANFTIALEKTLSYEGFYSNDPDDSGKETIYGISRVNHPTSSLWTEVDNYKTMVDITTKSGLSQFKKLCDNCYTLQQEVQRIYMKNYWYKIKGDFLADQSNANNLFDFAVNAGVSTAVKIAQKLVGVPIDGIFGTKTLEAVDDYQGFCNAYSNKRIEYYESLNKPKYIKGWTNRANSFKV